MKPQIVRVRRSRPSALALALALMLTMLFVYLISLSAAPERESETASVSAATNADVRMEGLSAAFVCEGRYDSAEEARIAAADCAQSGGAGLVLRADEGYAVVREAVAPSDAPEASLDRAADGLTLRLSGSADDVAAVSDAAAFLRAQAAETGNLAAALESGETDAASVAALLRVYRTQGERAVKALAAVSTPDAALARLQTAAQAALDRLDSAADAPDAGKIRLIHAAACAEWISLLTDLSEMSSVT